MELKQGVSLLEVLISLAIVTCTSLALLEHRLHVTHRFRQLEKQSQFILELNNTSEIMLSTGSIPANLYEKNIAFQQNNNQSFVLKSVDQAHVKSVRKRYLFL